MAGAGIPLGEKQCQQVAGEPMNPRERRGEKARGQEIGLLSFLLLVFAPTWAASGRQTPKVGEVRKNGHAARLEGETVLLRGKGKMNGDTFSHSVRLATRAAGS